MEAVSRFYMAGVLSGVSTWVEVSQLMSDTAWEYYHQFNDMIGKGGDQQSALGSAEWKERMQDNVRSYMRNLENLQIQYAADFERRAFAIIDSVFENEPAADAETKSSN